MAARMPDTVWKRITITRAISFVVLVAIIVIIGTLFYRVMANFLLPLFLAALLVVIFRPLHEWILARCGGRVKVAAGLTTATILLIVLVPIGLVISLAISEGISVAADLDIRTLQERLGKLRQTLGLESPYAETLRKIDAGLDELEREQDLTPAVHHARILPLLERVDQLEQWLTSGPAAEIAAETSDSPAERPVESTQGEAAQAFIERYQELVAPLRERLEELQAAYPSSLESERALTDAQSALRRLKQHLLGGAFRAWLKEMANPTENELRDLRNQAFDHFQGGLVAAGAATGAATLRGIVGLAIMIIASYFFFADGPAMLTSLMRLSPLDDHYETELLNEFIKISRAVVVATLLSALVQGVLAGIGFWVVGVDAVFLLAVLTALFALIPFVGAASVWVPVCLWLLFFEERTLAAILLAVYGTLIISTSDNVVKAMVLHGQSQLHPLLALLSVLGGVAALGPIGILVGPMVVVFLQTLLNILHRELAVMDRRDAADAPPPQVAVASDEPTTVIFNSGDVDNNEADNHGPPSPMPETPPNADAASPHATH